MVVVFQMLQRRFLRSLGAGNGSDSTGVWEAELQPHPGGHKNRDLVFSWKATSPDGQSGIIHTLQGLATDPRDLSEQVRKR